jgi:hypothetical protein
MLERFARWRGRCGRVQAIPARGADGFIAEPSAHSDGAWAVTTSAAISGTTYTEYETTEVAVEMMETK